MWAYFPYWGIIPAALITMLVYVIILGAMSYSSRAAWLGLFIGTMVFVIYAVVHIGYIVSGRLDLYWFNGIPVVPFVPAVVGGLLTTLIVRMVRESQILGFVSLIIATASLIGLLNVVLPIPNRTFTIYLALGVEFGAIMFQLFNFED